MGGSGQDHGSVGTIASGNGSRPNTMVEQITGTEARTFRDFARKNTAAWNEASK